MRDSPSKLISRRERQVLQLVAHEYTTTEIADALYISEHTVVSHRKKLMNKFVVRNTAGLVRRGFELGILTIDIMPMNEQEASKLLFLGS